MIIKNDPQTAFIAKIRIQRVDGLDARGSRAKVTEVNASHAVFVSQPAAVVRVIEAAAK